MYGFRVVSLRHIVIYDIGLGFMNTQAACQLMNKQFCWFKVQITNHHLPGYYQFKCCWWNVSKTFIFLQENGAEFRATEATGDIRCEVCEVSVNSSHQLQAHMTGGTTRLHTINFKNFFKQMFQQIINNNCPPAKISAIFNFAAISRPQTQDAVR